MDKRLTRHRNRRSRMSSFFADKDHAPLIAAHEDIAEDVAAFNTANTAWEAQAARIQELEDNDNAQAKKAAFAAMAQTMTRWGQRCLVRLRRLGLGNEASLADHQPSDFYHLDSAQAIDLATAMRDMLARNKESLKTQGINNDVLKDMDAKIAAADTVKTKPGEAAADLEAKREQLQAADAALELQLEEVVQTLHAEYRYTNTAFDQALMTQYELGGDTGKRYTGIEGTAKSSAGAALSGYTVRRADDHAKSSAVDSEGHYSIKGMRSGDVMFELVDAAGVVQGTKELRLKLGTVVVWDWNV